VTSPLFLLLSPQRCERMSETRVGNLSGPRLYRATAILSFGSALCSGCYGVLLLVASASPNGSDGGDVALLLMGILFLLASTVLLFAGKIALSKSRFVLNGTRVQKKPLDNEKKVTCPECRGTDLYRTNREGTWERLVLYPLGFRAYLCENCDARFCSKPDLPIASSDDSQDRHPT